MSRPSCSVAGRATRSTTWRWYPGVSALLTFWPMTSSERCAASRPDSPVKRSAMELSACFEERLTEGLPPLAAGTVPLRRQAAGQAAQQPLEETLAVADHGAVGVVERIDLRHQETETLSAGRQSIRPIGRE